MAGSRERLLYDRRSEYYEYSRRYDPYDRQGRYRFETRTERPDRSRRKNGYVYEDIYSDFDEAQGRLSLFRPIRPEYLHLPSTYDVKYNSLPRNYYNYDNNRYKKDYYDFRIDNERAPRRENNRMETKKVVSEIRNSKAKNVAVCKPLRLSERSARYWTTDPPERNRARSKKPEEVKKNVKFSEVSGCSRKMIVDDPIVGRKVVPVRELEVSLDQMIQNGYFEKHNIPISRPTKAEAKEEIKSAAPENVPNGKCLSAAVGKPSQLPRRTRHLPQVRLHLY